MAARESAKRKALRMIEHLAADSDWDDIMRELFVRMKIEQGVRAANGGRLVPHETVKDRFRARR